MTNTHETIADIIAEMRGIRVREFQEYADRFDAAHRRERGDCAKLREALKAIGGLCDRLIPTWDGAIGRIKDIAEAALSAPPRNCDIAQDWLHDLYVNFKPPASVKREMPPEWVDAVMAFCRWLVAPATEKEGGNDGND